MLTSQRAPYGAGASAFGVGSGAGAVPFGAPAPAGGLSLPFSVTSGPSGKGNLPSLDLPFPVSGFYAGQATPGLSANSTVPHHYLASVNKMDKDSRVRLADLHEGMIVFARNPNGAPAKGRGVGQRLDHPESANSVEMLEVNQLNEWLADKTDTYQSADDILREWRLLGVVKVEVAPKASSSLERREASSRILNVIVNGRVPALNIFGRVQAGDALYFTVKKETVSGYAGPRWVVRPHVARGGARPGARPPLSAPARPHARARAREHAPRDANAAQARPTSPSTPAPPTACRRWAAGCTSAWRRTRARTACRRTRRCLSRRR